MQLSSCLVMIFFPCICSGETAALILARGGSKGIRLKNLRTVGGVTLVTRAVQVAKTAGLNVTVSTDHFQIAYEALRSGASVQRRSRITATDWAPSIWGASEFLSSRPEVTILVLIQATSPFLSAKLLQEGLDKIEQPVPFDCVFSATRSFKLRWQEKNDTLLPLNFKLNARPRRQDWNGELLETGAFYVSRRNLIEEGSFQNSNCTVIEISPTESLEVDTVQDLKVANVLLRTTKLKKLKTSQ